MQHHRSTIAAANAVHNEGRYLDAEQQWEHPAKPLLGLPTTYLTAVKDKPTQCVLNTWTGAPLVLLVLLLLCRHNGAAAGYEAWARGFNESWMPTKNIHVDNLMR
jgi:hypothetical protein